MGASCLQLYFKQKQFPFIYLKLTLTLNLSSNGILWQEDLKFSWRSELIWKGQEQLISEAFRAWSAMKRFGPLNLWESGHPVMTLRIEKSFLVSLCCFGRTRDRFKECPKSHLKILKSTFKLCFLSFLNYTMGIFVH